MKTINLINLDNSEVKYELTVFPDGEPHIKLAELDRKDDYKVICRIANPNDLFLLMQVGDILNRQGVDFSLTITYLMSMRMDRVVNFDEAFTLNIVANIINAMHPLTVKIFEPHSNRSLSLIDKSMTMVVDDFNDLDFYASKLGMDVICFPDHGAQDRYKGEFGSFKQICMSKKRDLNDKGKILSLEVESTKYIKEDSEVSNVTIVDDLCDAGGTFCWAAKVLREKYPIKHLAIFVKHLVNPVGLKNLAENFDDVYVTNSYKDWDTTEYPNVHVIKII